METKHSSATDLRPEGSRVLDAPLVKADLNQLLDLIRDEKTWKTSDRNAITVFKTSGMRIVLIALHQDTEIARHKAEGIISIHVLEGRIQLISDAGDADLSAGMIATLHKDISHSIKAIEKSAFLLTIAD